MVLDPVVTTGCTLGPYAIKQGQIILESLITLPGLRRGQDGSYADRRLPVLLRM